MYKYLINKLKNERGELFSPAASYFLSEKRIKDSEKKAADAAAAEAEKAREEQRRIEELYGTLTPEEKEREKRDIGLESLGRAGVDAAIKGAQQRLDAQTNLTNTLLNLSSGARGEAGAVGERALSESGTAKNNLQRSEEHTSELQS